MRIGPIELGLVLIGVLVVFGARRLPEVFTQLGKAGRNFRDPPDDDLPPRVPTGTRTHENSKPKKRDEE